MPIFLLFGQFAHADSIRPNSGFTNSNLERYDDSNHQYTSLDFELNFFGNNYSELYVNDNGNITFEVPLTDYTAFVIEQSEAKIIAPFFADVDTTSAGSPISYGHDNVNGRPAFGVNWIDVDYYVGSVEHKNRNDFQLVLIERSDISPGDFDIEFNYGKIQWESGSESGGDIDGLGGISARVGWSNGLSNQGKFFELPGSGINGALLDNGSSSLIKNSYNTNAPGRYIFEVRNGILTNPASSEIRPASQLEFFDSPENIAVVGGGAAAVTIGMGFIVALKMGIIGTKTATMTTSVVGSSLFSTPSSSISNVTQSGVNTSNSGENIGLENASVTLEISGGIE